MTLIDRTKRIAKTRGWNLKQTAAHAGLSENAIYGWKNHKPTRATLLLVASTLGVSYEELTGEKELKSTNIDLKASIDDDDVTMTYEGRPIPKEDLEYIKRILNGGK